MTPVLECSLLIRRSEIDVYTVSCVLQLWRAISCSVGFWGFLRKRDHAMCKQIVLLFFFLLAGFVPAEACVE